MTVFIEHDRFLRDAARALTAVGGENLLSPHAVGPTWARGWDQVILSNNPGAVRLYAFTESSDLEDFAQKLDDLVRGLSQSGFLSDSPLSLVAVICFAGNVDSRTRLRLLHTAPHTFIPGLRPSVWVADLESRELYTGARLGTPEGAPELHAALRGAPQRAGTDAEAEAALILHHTRMDAFYGLMRGRTPWITYGLIAINVLVFLALVKAGGPGNPATLRQFGGLVPELVRQGQWWRLFSTMFLHASIPHILFNMTSLFVVGTLAERLYGSVRFLAIYLGAGLIGSLVSFAYGLASGHVDVVGVGASGAIFGVAGALVTVRFQRSEVIPRRLRERVSSSMIPLVVLSLFLSYLTPYVDNSAHLGGLFGGIGLSFLLPLTRHIPLPRGAA